MAESTAVKPQHVAIIMDGNGRWARSRKLARTAGHRQGLEAARTVALACRAAEVDTLSLFAFSTDNWRRPPSEVAALLELLAEGLSKHLPAFLENSIRIRFIGDLSSFPKPVRTALDRFERATADCDRLTMLVALNYSGRWDIAEAVRQLADCGHDMSTVTEDDIAAHLATATSPLPDLLIRTSGELRLSNFMLWQSAYTELYFTDVLWPDFGEAELTAAFTAYAARERRFGSTETTAASTASVASA